MFLFRKPKPHKTHAGKIALTLHAHKINVVLDVGANIGQTGRQLREHGYKGRILSFEPIPSNHSLLTAAAAKDDLWVVAPRTAVGAQSGEIIINESESSDMSSIRSAEDSLMTALPKTRMIATHVTPVCTVKKIINQYCSPNDRIFVKIDTQGYEQQVLDGFGDAWAQIVGVQIEMSLFSLYSGEALFIDLCQQIISKGFEPHLMLETTFSRKLNRQLQVDGIFYRSS